MKALSVRQPYANTIAAGDKTVEVRSWPTRHRGPLLICASARRHGSDPVGCAICVVDVVDCRPLTRDDLHAAQCDDLDGDDLDGLYALVLASPHPVPHVRVRGRLGIWTVPDDVVEALGLPCQLALDATAR